jgi:hypothetical protein
MTHAEPRVRREDAGPRVRGTRLMTLVGPKARPVIDAGPKAGPLVQVGPEVGR